MQVNRKVILDVLEQAKNRMHKMNEGINVLLAKRELLEKQIFQLESTLRALNETDGAETISLVELRYMTIPIPGNFDKAWIGTNRVTMLKSRFKPLFERKGELIAVKVDHLKFARTRHDIKIEHQRIDRGYDNNGFEVIEYVEKAYITSEDYDKFYLQAKNKWREEQDMREGLKLRVIER